MSTLTSRRGFVSLLAVAALASQACAAPAAGQQPAVVVAIDTAIAGNSARSVGSVESCVSATAGAPFDIDIVLPAPGVPSTRGLAGFQFNLYFDPAVFSLTSQDVMLLLAQAQNSAILRFSGPLPNDNGNHYSVAVDFAGRGVEPAGAGEIGPGVISRLTLLPKANGLSKLALRNVVLKDPEGVDLPSAPISDASISVGAPCPTPAAPPTAPPQPRASATPVRIPATPVRTLAAAPSSVADFELGGAPGSRVDPIYWLIAAGTAATASGTALMIAATGLSRSARGTRASPRAGRGAELDEAETDTSSTHPEGTSR